jgi:hypothetical protein
MDRTATPVLLVVRDASDESDAVQRTLRSRYGNDYDVVARDSAVGFHLGVSELLEEWSRDAAMLPPVLGVVGEPHSPRPTI